MNAAEERFKELAKDSSWEVTKLGWPDFFCWKDGRIVIIEVKPDHGDSELRRTQRIILAGLASFGIPCFRWSPQRGFSRIRGNPTQFARQLKINRKTAKREHAREVARAFHKKKCANVLRNGITEKTINQHMKSWKFIYDPLLTDRELHIKPPSRKPEKWDKLGL
jgi:hypothetical protein